MMVEPLGGTIESYISKTDSLCMVANIAGEKQPFEDIFRGDEDLEIKGDKENFSEEEEFDCIQKGKSMDDSIEAFMEMRNQDLILMKNEEILSQKGNQMSLINVFDENKMQENVNVEVETNITLGEELQGDSKAKCTEEEGHLLKYVKEEEAYEKDLEKGERTSNDLSITKEGMENCVKFSKSTPIEIVELYRKLDFQRRELERQRIDVQERC